MARPSKIVTCTECEKKMRARGLCGHMKLKHNIILPKMTRVKSENFNDSSNDSSNDSGKTEKRVRVIAGKSGVNIIKPPKPVAAEKSEYIGLNGLESDYLQFKPRYSDWVIHYRKNPELALKQWERIIRIEKQYAWPILHNPERYRALQVYLASTHGYKFI